MRVAVGLDSLSAAPLRGTRYGGAGEVISVKLRVDQAVQQIQNCGKIAAWPPASGI